MYKIHKSQKARDSQDAVDIVVSGVTHPNDVVVYHSLQQPQGQSALFRDLENLEKSGNFSSVREKSGKLWFACDILAQL